VKKPFIDEHRHEYGVEPICRVLQIAPSTYREHAARQAAPSRAPARVKRDAWLRAQIRRVWEESFQLYGIRKVWHQLRREGIKVARCTVERLMRSLGIEGVRRGKSVKTTVADKALPYPLDRVNRQFSADRPDQLWVPDFTHVKTQRGMTYVAFVTDVFSRHTVGWKVSTTPRTDFVLNALEQALVTSQALHLITFSMCCAILRAIARPRSTGTAFPISRPNVFMFTLPPFGIKL